MNSSSDSALPAPLHQSSSGRASHRHWKLSEPATIRSRLSPAISKAFALRAQERVKQAAIKGVERELQEEKEGERRGKAERIRERRERVKEKARLEEMASKMSAKKLQRLKKRLGRTKKVNA